MKRKKWKSAASEGPAPQGSYVSGGTHSEQRMGKVDAFFLAKWNGGRSTFFVCCIYHICIGGYMFCLISQCYGILWEIVGYYEILGGDEMVPPAKSAIISSGLQSTVIRQVQYRCKDFLSKFSQWKINLPSVVACTNPWGASQPLMLSGRPDASSRCIMLVNSSVWLGCHQEGCWGYSPKH